MPDKKTLKCKDHNQSDATYLYLKKGTTDVFYLCNICDDEFEENYGNKDEYTFGPISTKDVENLKEKIESLKTNICEKSKRIKNIIDKKNGDFKFLVEKIKDSLINVVTNSAEEYLNSFNKFNNSKFITNFQTYLSQTNELSQTFENYGQEYNDESYYVRNYVSQNISHMENLVKDIFEQDRRILNELKINEKVINFDPYRKSGKIILDIFQKGFSELTEFLKGQQINISLNKLESLSQKGKLLYKSQNQLLNFYGFLNLEKTQFDIIKDPQNKLNYNLIKSISKQFIDNQKYYYFNQLSKTTGFFPYDKTIYPFDNNYIFLIIEIILQRAFGDSFFSYDPNSFQEGIVQGNVQLIYADKNIKNFSFKNQNGKENNNNKSYSNGFIRIKANFNSTTRNQNIYIFKDEFSIYYDHQNMNEKIQFFNNNDIPESIYLNQDVRSHLFSNLQNVNNRLTDNISFIHSLPDALKNNFTNQKKYNSLVKSTTNDNNNSDKSKLGVNTKLDHSNKKKTEITQEIYLNKRNPHKMLDYKKLQTILEETKDVDEITEKKKTVFSHILNYIFKNKIVNIMKIEEGRLHGLFMIINKNKLFEVSYIDENLLSYGYEITCTIKIENNLTEAKFYFLRNGLCLIKPLNDYEKYDKKNYFISNNIKELTGRDEIYFPEILNSDLENYLNQDYQSNFKTKHASEAEKETAKLKIIRDTFLENFETLPIGQTIAYKTVIDSLFTITNNHDLKNLKVSQIKEYFLDLELIKQKLLNAEMNKQDNDMVYSQSFDINHKKKSLIGFELKYINDLFSSHAKDCPSRELNNIQELKSIFVDKKFNNKVFKVDLFFDMNDQQHFSTILLFLDIPKIHKKNNNNNYYYLFKNDDKEINEKNLKVFFINPLEKLQVFRYKCNGSKKNIFNYSDDYFSFKNFIDCLIQKDKIEENEKNKLIQHINSKDFIKNSPKTNERQSFEDHLIKNGNLNSDISEMEIIQKKNANIITEQYFVDNSKNLKLPDEDNSEIFNFRGDVKYVIKDGHIKDVFLNNEEVIKKEIYEIINDEEENIKTEKHSIYLIKNGLYPIKEFVKIEESKDLQNYPPKIQEILDLKIIEKCKEMEINPLFDNIEMKMFYVEKLRLILDVSDSMDLTKELSEIRDEVISKYSVENVVEYSIKNEKLENTHHPDYIFPTILKCSEEASVGEAIYFVSDFELKSELRNEDEAKEILIEKLTSKKQRLYLHSFKHEISENFKEISEKTGGWSIVHYLGQN